MVATTKFRVSLKWKKEAVVVELMRRWRLLCCSREGGKWTRRVVGWRSHLRVKKSKEASVRITSAHISAYNPVRPRTTELNPIEQPCRPIRLIKEPNRQGTLRDKVKSAAGVRSDDGTGPEKVICVMGHSGELSLSG